MGAPGTLRVVLLGLAEHFDPLGSCPQWVRGPQVDPARLLVASWGRGPVARLGLWRRVCPGRYEEEGVRTDNVYFYRREIEALTGSVLRVLGCRESLGLCPDHAETY